MTKEEIIIKHLDARYAGISPELRYIKTVQFPNKTVELMMQEYADQETSPILTQLSEKDRVIEELTRKLELVLSSIDDRDR